MDENELYKRLHAYGADIGGINSRFFDEREFYMECFCDFLKDPAFNTLGESIAKRDCESAFNDAHALKGISANLGLKPFYDAVCVLVESVRDNNCDKIDAEYKTVLLEKRKLEEILK